MAKRLPRPTLLRGLIKGRVIHADKKSLALINAKLDDPKVYRALNEYYSENQGNRWVTRFKVWVDWLYKHREAIMRILGLVIMFAEDGSPVVSTVEDAEKAKSVVSKAPQRAAGQSRRKKSKPVVEVIETVHGVKDEVVITPTENPLDDDINYGLGIVE